MLNPQLFLAMFLLLSNVACHTSSLEPMDGHPKMHVIPKNLIQINNAIPKHENFSKFGNPKVYTVLGKTYRVLPSSLNYKQTGLASWYGTKFHGRRTSSGEAYDMFAMTAAHKTLPIPCYARIDNLQNGQHIIVKINDRGPFHPHRIVDLSYAAAAKLGVLQHGVSQVRLTTIDPKQYNPKQGLAQTEDRLQAGLGSSVYAKKLKTQALNLNSTAQLNRTRRPYYLQVGAFKLEASAKRLQLELSSHSSKVQIIFSTKDQLYKVRIGPYKNRRKALAETEWLSQHNFPLAVPSQE